MLKVFINNSQLEYNGDFNLVASLGNIRNLKAGSQLNTYTLNIPMTPTNKNILGFVDDISVERNVYTGAWLEFDEVIILRGSVLLMSVNDVSARLIITAQDWIKAFSGISIRDLTGLGTFDYDSTNIEASWSASYPFIRYPLIDNGVLASGETGSTADWTYIDFIPFFQIKDIIADIFAKYSIQSSINAATKWLNTYVSGARTVADPSFIKDKGLEVKVNSTSDESDSASIPASGNDDFEIDADPCQLNNEVTDEGNDFLTSTDKYTVPETGTYKFKATVQIVSTAWGGIGTIDSSQYTISIRSNTLGAMVTESCNQSDGSCITTVELDTGFIHLVKNDTIWLDAYIRCTATNNDPSARTFTLWLGTNTALELEWSNINLLPAAGTHNVVDFLPDIDQLVFLRGIKQAYNLQFFLDRDNGAVYFEPADDICTANIKDISSRIIGSHEVEEISSEYKKTQRLKWQHDSGDFALEQYLDTNKSEVGQYDVTLSNPNCEDGIDEFMNPVFAPIAEGNCYLISNYTVPVPRLWKEWDKSKYFTAQEKLTSYLPRLVEWKGYTTAITWYFEGVAKSYIPKVEAIDFEDQYQAYYLKTFYRINLGRILKVEIVSDVAELSEFVTVLADDESEGFRITYMATIDGVALFYVLNKITHNGTRAKLELTQKI